MRGKRTERESRNEKRNHVEHKNTRDGWINHPKVIFIEYQLFNWFHDPERNLLYTNKFLKSQAGRGRREGEIEGGKQRGKYNYYGREEGRGEGKPTSGS